MPRALFRAFQSVGPRPAPLPCATAGRRLGASALLLLGMALGGCKGLGEPARAGVPLVGINVAGAEFTPDKMPGRLNYDFFYPEQQHFQYYQSKGIRLIRFPFAWERLQQQLGGPLNEEQVMLLNRTLDLAAAHGIQVLLDMHNYARYNGELIGSPSVPNAAFADVWRRLASEFRGQPALFGYDIMNEPYQTNGLWPAAAQAAVDAIREVDRDTLLIIEGDRWANATYWPEVNGDLDIQDPSDNLMYQAHLYFDEDFSGRYEKLENVDPMHGVERVRPFVEWLRQNGHRGFLGEHGIPDDSPSMLPAMDNLLAYLNSHCIPSTYWAGGPAWGDYRLSIEPRDGKDRPQMKILEKHVRHSCPAFGPFPTER